MSIRINLLPRLVAPLLSVVAAATFSFGSTAAHADAYPSRPIHFIVPFAPGGTTDIISRQYAVQLSKRLGQTVIVENRPGASTNIAGQVLAASKPDGYTLMVGTPQMLINSVFGPKPSFDAVNSFAPVGMLAEFGYAVAVDAKSPVTSVRDFVASARGREIPVSSAQFDNQLKLLSSALNVPLLSIPFKGAAASISAVFAGEVPAVLAGVPGLMSQVKAGKLRAIGVSSLHRTRALPDVPTFAEQGYPKFAVSAWLAVLAPKGTPELVVRRLSEATQAIVNDAGFEQRLAALGADPVTAGPAETGARIKAERELWLGFTK